METGNEKGPFEPPDTGVYISGGSAFQYVSPPLPQDDDLIDTSPIPVFQGDNDSPQEDSDVRATIGPFRRHLKEPIMRLFPTNDSPKAYKPLAGIGSGVVIVGLLLNASQPHPGLLIGSVGMGLLVFFYPFLREVHRWRKRTQTVELLKDGKIRITYTEPDNAFYLFSGNARKEEIEGSRTFELRRTLADKFFFWGCGSIEIAGKVEGSKEGDLSNVPRAQKLYELLAQEPHEPHWIVKLFHKIRRLSATFRRTKE